MSELLRTDEEVGHALATGRPVVALETSVLAQGLPAPHNLEAARSMEQAIRHREAVPAWIAIDRGAVRVSVDPPALDELSSGAAMKVARRDVPAALAAGGLGATTVSATLWAAHRAGVSVTATGGIGGVHPRSGDVSADLPELARTPGLVVCSGPKSIVDPRATAERLEELGVLVVGYRCERMPFFLARDSDVELEHRADSPGEVAALVRIARTLGTQSAILLCSPIPVERAMDSAVVARAVADCELRALRDGVRGKALTPYLLSCLGERTGGASLQANLAALAANAALAAEVAVALAPRATRRPG